MEILAHKDGASGEPLGVWPLHGTGVDPFYVDGQSRTVGFESIAAAGGIEEAAEALVAAKPEVWEVTQVEGAPTGEMALGVLRSRWAGIRAKPGSAAFAAGVRRRRFAATVAPELAALLLGDAARPHVPGGRVSATIVLYESADDQRLLVMVPPGETPRAIDGALAYGLSYQGDRDLVIALPAPIGGDALPDVALPTLMRSAWIVTPVEVFTYRPDAAPSLSPVPRLALVETGARARIDDELPMKAHPLGQRERWIVPIIEQMEQLADVEEAHRQSYRAWHVLGRQVLQVHQTRSGLRLTAGVNYSSPRAGRPAPVVLDLVESITSDQIDELMAAVRGAREARLAGNDRENLEALLQARLGSTDGVAALGLVGPVLREVPASRPPGKRAYIDLLGVDARGTIHLVETKLGDDLMLALQGLDYWVWLREHLPQVVAELRRRGHDLRDEPQVVVDYVVGDPSDRRHPKLRYLPPQLETINGKVAWRLATITGWSTPGAVLAIDWQPKRHIPDLVNRIQPPRFSHRLRQHLVQRVGDAGLLTRRVFLSDPDWTVRAAAGPVLAQLRRDGLAHHMLDHICSSQRFAIELFAGLGATQRLALTRHLDDRVVAVDPVQFEYTDPHDRLREATRDSPHATQVDVLLRATRQDGSRQLLLIEVKLTEDDFGGCSAFQSDRNPDRHICRTPAPFGGDVEQCFQLRNHDREHRRRYDEYLPVGAHLPGEAMCPFAHSGNQPMRNLALAAALIAGGEADGVTFAVCAHDEHAVIWRRWQHVQALLPKPDTVSLASLPASTVLKAHDPADAADLAAHYALPDPTS